jgi:hypothetical protein
MTTLVAYKVQCPGAAKCGVTKCAHRDNHEHTDACMGGCFQTTGCQAIRVNCHDTCLWKSPESCANCEGR